MLVAKIYGMCEFKSLQMRKDSYAFQIIRKRHIFVLLAGRADPPARRGKHDQSYTSAAFVGER